MLKLVGRLHTPARRRPRWTGRPRGSQIAPRCLVVHWYRNIFSHVPSTKVREIAAMLKAIHAGEDIAAAREKAIRVIEKLRGLRLNRAAELVEMAVEETLAYYAFPEEHWWRIRPTTQCELIHILTSFAMRE